MARPTLSPRLRRLLPWALVLGLALWLGAPFLGADDRLFGGFTGDRIKSQWYYDYVARVVIGERSPWWLEDFNFPEPALRGRQFPALADALLAAPAGILLDWPRQWGAVQLMVLVGNGLGFAALARALGAGGLGLTLSGVLGVGFLPMWRELQLGRLNSAWPGLVALGLAVVLHATRPDGGSLLRRAPWVLPIALLGALAGVIYPPFLLMLAPFGGVALLPHLRRKSLWGWGVVLVGICLAIGLAWPDLVLLRRVPRSVDLLAEGECPRPENVLPLGRWLVTRLPLGQFPVQAAVGLFTWVGAPLALAAPGRRLLVFTGLLSMLFFALLGLGACPSWLDGQPLVSLEGDLAGLARSAATRLAQVHDHSRFGVMAALIGAVLTGIGVDAIGQRGRPGRLIAALLALSLGGGAAWQGWRLVMQGDLWSAVPRSASAAVIRTLAPSPLIELPFNPSWRFISALQAPGPRRVNPLDDINRPPQRDPAAAWLYELGHGTVGEPPQLAAFDRSEVRWALWEQGRCTSPQTLAAACDAAVLAALRATLGQPEIREGGVLLWDLHALGPSR